LVQSLSKLAHYGIFAVSILTNSVSGVMVTNLNAPIAPWCAYWSCTFCCYTTQPLGFHQALGATPPMSKLDFCTFWSSWSKQCFTYRRASVFIRCSAPMLKIFPITREGLRFTAYHTIAKMYKVELRRVK
jgi:hypothetical protein